MLSFQEKEVFGEFLIYHHLSHFKLSNLIGNIYFEETVSQICYLGLYFMSTIG